MMKCKVCDQHFVDILKHILKNEACKAAYNVDHILEERKLLRLDKKRNYMRKRYVDKNEEILKQRKDHYESEKQRILKDKKNTMRSTMTRFMRKRLLTTSYQDKDKDLGSIFLPKMFFHIFLNPRSISFTTAMAFASRRQ